MSPQRSADVVIVGGGVMGCAIALALAARGVTAVVLEKSVPGAEASSAAAGMLGAQTEAPGPGPFLDLSVASRALFPGAAERLRELTGIDVEYRRSGIVRVATGDRELDELRDLAGWQREAGLAVEIVGRTELRELEPELGERASGGVIFRDDGRVDPPKYLRALRIAAERSGARFATGSMVRRVRVEGGRARGVELESGEVALGAHVVIAAGSWSGLVEGATLEGGVVQPARGHIVELVAPMPALSHVLWGPGVYLSPRDDGRVLVGSTLEFVGFERAVTAGAVATLLGAAIELVPCLAKAEMSRAWSSFRPYTRDHLPILGPTSLPGLLLATGHYRNGILLSPITAEIVACLVQGEAPPVDLAPFLPRPLERVAHRGDTAS